MKWTRPLEQSIELGLVLWLWDLFVRPLYSVQRQGRFVYASRQKLQDWLHREASGEPVQIASEETDLSAQLKRGLS